MKQALTKAFWNFRNALLAYHDDFDDAHTQARLSALDPVVMPGIQAANGDDVYVLRGIAHFRAQMTVRSTFSLICTELLSIPLLTGGILLSVLRGLYPATPHLRKGDAFLMLANSESEGRSHIYKIPDDFAGQNVAKVYVSRAQSLKSDDWRILGRLAFQLVRTRCPYPVQYVFKVFKDLLFGRGYIDAFRDAKTAIISQEYSCSLSLLTLQQHKAGKQMVNIMHGDNAASTLESYFIVDWFYCWAPFYADLFKRQRIAAEFPIAVNPDLTLRAGERVADDGIGVLVPMMNFLPDRFDTLNDLIPAYALQVTIGLSGQAATVRPHPAYPWTLQNFMEVAGGDYAVSDPQKEPAHAFILRHRLLIGFYSTVLVEAACLGCDVVLVQYPASESRAKYHYIFDLPNVRHVSLDDLPSFLASFTTTTNDLKTAKA